MKNILKAYLKRLTNLSQRNRSLLLLKNSAIQDFDLSRITSLEKEQNLSLIETILKGKSVELIENIDPRFGSGNDIAKNISKLKRRDDFIFRESGAKDLYLGWPFVHGKFSGEQSVRCPLLFFPISLRLENNKWFVDVRQDVNITFNKSFLLAYGYFNQIKIEDEFLETVFNDFDYEIRPFLTSLYNLIKDSPLELNFNQDLFAEKIIPFKSLKKDEFSKKYSSGELKLFSEGLIGIFPQSGSHLVTDYNELIDSAHFNDLEDFFAKKNPVKQNEDVIGSPYRMHFLSKLKEEDTYTPFPIDSSQENALKAIKQHNSLVIQGPPGSGKSQLICNMIADFASRGKKVLLVCQKRAALDVVYERLKEIKAEKFCALVHDFKNDRKAIYEQISCQIDSLNEFEQLNNGLDSIFLERNYQKACRKIDVLTEELEDFKNALFESKDSGVSVKELYLKSNIEDPSVPLTEEFSHYNFNDINEKKPIWEQYSKLSLKYEDPNYLWRERVSFKDFTATDLNSIVNALNEIPVFKKQVNEKASLFAKRELSLEEHLDILKEEKEIRAFLRIIQDETVFEVFVRYVQISTDTLVIQNRQRIIMDCFGSEGVEMSVPTKDLGNALGILQNALSKRRNIFNWWAYSLFSNESYKLKRILVSNGLEMNRNDLGILEKKMDNRMNLEHNLSFLRNLAWVNKLPEERDKKSILDWFEIQNKALSAKAIIESFRTVRENFEFKSQTLEGVNTKMESLISLSVLIHDKFKVWNKHLSKKQINEYLFSDQNQELLIKQIRSDFDDLCYFDRLKSQLDPIDVKVLERIFETHKLNSPEEVFKIFINSLSITWIEHLEKKYPELMYAGTTELEHKVSELQNAISEKQSASNEILLLRLREHTYKSLEFNRLNNMITYRDLKHQVNKKRKIWPLRQVISNHFDELFQLIPCWMASPESVSAMFPLEDIFDLVIFDEASQCFSEQGIPAVYRSKQVVILGDSQQLQPNNLYQIRYDLEDEEDIDLEKDSLLELGEHHLMSVQLKGHYRSSSLDLIDFSNKHFYNGSLRFLPSPNSLFSTEKAIEFHYLKNGIWDENKNAVEAEEVVRITKSYIDKGIKNIGIITFNFFQQTYIQDLMEEKAEVEGWEIPEELFVKNIENVQGDEREIIIFSISYAKDKNGKLKHQFGSLNALNGENRLNVAITRARKKIHLISSIKAEALKTDELKHKGPKLLKEYLDYAWKVSDGTCNSFFENNLDFKEDWYLKNRISLKLQEKNIHYSTDLPFVDLMIWKEEGKGKLVFTDDNIFYQSYSAKEIFAYRPMELLKKNWDYTFCFSRRYWISQEETENYILRFIER